MAGSGTATSAAAAASEDAPDPHLAAARAVLDGLVRGTYNSGVKPIAWAVAIIEAAGATWPVIANDAGGGSYLPAKVFLPVHARLAVHDPVLAAGWAGDRFVVCPKPTEIIESYYAELKLAPIFSPRVLAVATTEPAGRRLYCGGAFDRTTTAEILRRRGEPPVLDRAHLHRLHASNPALHARVWGVVGAADDHQLAAVALAAVITDAVLAAAPEPVRLPADDTLWAALKAGTADAADWEAWTDASDAARDPENFAAQRIAELLGAWRAGSTADVADVAYVGQVTYPEAVNAAIAAAEQR